MNNKKIVLTGASLSVVRDHRRKMLDLQAEAEGLIEKTKLLAQKKQELGDQVWQKLEKLEPETVEGNWHLDLTHVEDGFAYVEQADGCQCCDTASYEELVASLVGKATKVT